LFMKEEIDLLSSSRNNKYLMFIFLVLDVHKFTCILSIIQCNKGICAVICSHWCMITVYRGGLSSIFLTPVAAGRPAMGDIVHSTVSVSELCPHCSAIPGPRPTNFTPRLLGWWEK
jgi:hypothetical protein